MATATTTNTGKKGRKFGRHARSASMATYKAVSRDKINKARRMAKHAAKVKADSKKVLGVPRGTARNLRRYDLQMDYEARHHSD